VNRKTLLSTFLLLLTFQVTLRAQAPDLSGTWKLNLEKSKLPKDSKIQSETIVITCSGANIEMHYVTDGRESMHNYTADGKEKVIVTNPGGETVAKARWKGSILTIETISRLKMPDQPGANGSEIMHDKETWELSPDGRLLTLKFADTKHPYVYDKVPI
jgi:membrane-bound inhibitor of C-type lysozyme